MAVQSAQITTSTSIQPVWPSTSTTFLQLSGAVGDPLPLQIKNIDASITIYIGGANVSSSNGYPLLAGQSISTSWLQAEVTTLYCVAASATPKLAVLTARQ